MLDLQWNNGFRQTVSFYSIAFELSLLVGTALFAQNCLSHKYLNVCFVRSIANENLYAPTVTDCNVVKELKYCAN